MRDYHYYYQWSYEIPLGLLLSIIGVGVGVYVLRLVLYSIQKYICASKSSDWEVETSKSGYSRLLKCANDALKDIMLRMSNFLLIEFEENDEIYKLFNVQMHGFVLHYIFLVIMGNIAVCIISFWNVFGVDILINEWHSRYDCFPLNKADLSPIETLPMDYKNFEGYVSDDNVTIVCFQLTRKYSEGLGKAGGFLFIVQLLTNILIYFTVRCIQIALCIYNNCHYSTINKWYKTIVPFGISVTLSVLLAGTFVSLSVFFRHEILSDKMEFINTPNQCLETWIYYLRLVLSITPLVFGIGIRFDTIITHARKNYIEKDATEYKTTENTVNTIIEDTLNNTAKNIATNKNSVDDNIAKDTTNNTEDAANSVEEDASTEDTKTM